jgi:hypothetical protein
MYSNIGVVQAIAPAVQSATVESSEIDLLGFNSATVIVSTGAIVSSGSFTAKLQETDDPGASPEEWSDVAAADMIGEFPAALSAASVVRVGFTGHSRYIRVVLTKNSGTSIAAGAVVVKGHPASAPVA